MAKPAVQRPAPESDPGADDQSAPISPVVTAPSSARSPSRPSNVEFAPRPQTEAKPPPGPPARADRAKDVPVTTSCCVSARVSKPGPPPAPFPSSCPAKAIQRRIATAASPACAKDARSGSPS